MTELFTIKISALFSLPVVILTTVLFGVMIIGDNLFYTSQRLLVRALVDNITHGLVGFISWMIIQQILPSSHAKFEYSRFSDCLLCYIMASIIDIDHFILAKSFSLKDAVSLTSRPMLHNSTFAAGIVGLIFGAGIWEPSWEPLTWPLGWMALVAFISHHSRDANRRGFWVWPFGSTAPINYRTYVLITLCLPFGVAFLMNTHPRYKLKHGLFPWFYYGDQSKPSEVFVV